MKILATWTSTIEEPKYYTVGENDKKFSIGEYAIYKQWGDCYLYTFQNVAINQLAGFNEDHLISLYNNNRPESNQQAFLFDRAKESKERGLKLLKSI